MSDIESIGPDAPVPGIRTRARTGAYVEQWQRELEAACQRYVSAARSTGRGEQDPVSPRHLLKETPADVPAPPAAARPPDVASRSAGTGAAPAGAGSNASPGGAARTGAALPPEPQPLLLPASAPRPGCAPPARTSALPERAGGLPDAARRLLPDASSVRLLRAGGHLHLVVRDSALEPASLLRLVSRIRASLGAGGGRLLAITLNGERIWQSGPNGPVSPAAGPERAVDRHY
jgi:hypothetical protein